MRYTFNNQSFEIEIELYNEKNNLKLTQNAFEELTFEEDIFKWEVVGHIVLYNQYELFRKNPDSEKEEANKFFKYMGNGNDLISIKIIPYIFKEPTTTPSGKSFDITLPFPQWGIQFEAVIVDMHDLGGHGSEKKLKLDFIEHSMFKLLSQNLDFSTTDMASIGLPDDAIIKMTNYDRSLKTGDAIYSLLEKADLTKHLENYKTPKWDIGDEKNKVFYTSPSNRMASEDLDILLDQHTSDEIHNNEPCFFRFERNLEQNKPKQFSLIPYSEYFKKAGEG